MHWFARPTTIRALALAASAVAGLALLPASPSQAQPSPAEVTTPPPSTPRFGIGLGVLQSLQTGRSMDGAVRFGPLIQAGSWRQGWGPAFSFSATSASLHLHEGAAPQPIGSARLRPLLAGARYRFSRFAGSRLSLSVAMLAGYAVNRATPDERAAAAAAARSEPFDLRVGDAAAFRPQVTLWIDLGPRLDVQLQAGYQVLRPMVSVTRGGSTERRRWNADALLVSAGFAVGLF